MKTVEIVKTLNGCYITRRYCGMNKGRKFFPNVKGKTKNTERDNEMKKYVTEWTGE